MTAGAVQYGKHEKPAVGTPCGVCGQVPPVTLVDHCHAHGWVRGPVCRRCNTALALTDRGIAPLRVIEQIPLEALLRHARNCPDCVVPSASDLRASGGLRGSKPLLNIAPKRTNEPPSPAVTSTLARLVEYKTTRDDLMDAVAEAKRLNIEITTIAETAGIARSRVYRILDTVASVQRGLAQSAAGETVDLGDFSQYAKPEETP